MLAPDREEQFGPGRLWSLWDVYRILVKPFLEIQDMLVQITLLGQQDRHAQAMVGHQAREDMVRRLNLLIAEMSAQDLAMCRVAAERLRDCYDQGGSIDQIIHNAQDLRRRMLDQIDSLTFYALSMNEHAFFSPEEPLFGENAYEKIEGIPEDMSEAGKCFALARYTATVFHLMRALERIVRALGKKLNVTVIDKNDADLDWGKIISNLKVSVEAMNKGPEKDK